MAIPDIVKGSYVDVLMGDGAGAETFSPICGITTRTFTAQVNTNDVFVPDCVDPENIPVRRVNPTGRQWDLSGEGLLNLANWQLVNTALGHTGNFRFVVTRPIGNVTGIGYYAGPAMITNMQIGGTVGGGEFATVSLTIASDGEWLLTNGAQP